MYAGPICYLYKYRQLIYSPERLGWHTISTIQEHIVRGRKRIVTGRLYFLLLCHKHTGDEFISTQGRINLILHKTIYHKESKR